LDPKVEKFATVVAIDLLKSKGQACVIIGERQPPEIHALGILINYMIGNTGAPQSGGIRFRYDMNLIPGVGLDELASGIDSGTIKKVVCLDTNPVYDAPGELGMADKFTKLDLLVHTGLYRDETGQVADLHLPISHALESWSDLESSQGTISICQPTIAPLYDTPSLHEVLAHLSNAEGKKSVPSSYELVRQTWNERLRGGLSDAMWRKWIHSGVASGIPQVPSLPRFTADGWKKMGESLRDRKVPQPGWEVNFHLDPNIGAGEFSNNAWMQEVPHPMSKVSWDNAAYIGKGAAKELRLQNGDFLVIKVGQRNLSVPVWITPGQADQSVSINLGYGRRDLGSVADGTGFDVNPLRSTSNPWFQDCNVSRGSGHYKLATTQTWGSQDPDGPDGRALAPELMDFAPRPIYKETTVAGYKKDPDFADKGNLMPPQTLHPLWDPPVLTGEQQW
ncbi:MAG: hypothetical protein GY888_18425, partial [Planctomycetaceae bacterium]|nr:hypothetical protein [Planctomycetaceae bacterium]